VVALSGGADSVFLLHSLCASRERPPLYAVHVHHGLRGAEADADARFCVELGRELDVPVHVRRVELDPAGPSLEARAREARYRVLADEALRLHARVIATGHHADDGLETLLMRWIRGSDLGGLAGLRGRVERGRRGRALLVVRPLISLRRAEIRRLLSDAGLGWREDSSNRDARFTRNRVRDVLLPKLGELGGAGALENLHAFAHAVEDLERELASRTAELAWSPPAGAPACRNSATFDLGGVLPRSQLMALPLALRRRALWRLIVEGTARGPSERNLERILADLAGGRSARHTLRGGWQLQLAPSRNELEPPERLLGGGAQRLQPWLPFPELVGESELPPQRVSGWVSSLEDPPQGFPLPVPGSVTLPDGRRITAELADVDPSAPPARESLAVELDFAAVRGPIRVRWPRAGDRFHPLRAPGSRPLRRFLADAGVPRGERRRVPLVVDAERVLWVAGLRPCDAASVGPTTTRRLRLSLRVGRRAPATESARALASASTLAVQPLQLDFFQSSARAPLERA
jgi:tRNA(Ile)-lysidine synthase